jgi:hypothetical protein
MRVCEPIREELLHDDVVGPCEYWRLFRSRDRGCPDRGQDWQLPLLVGL